MWNTGRNLAILWSGTDEKSSKNLTNIILQILTGKKVSQDYKDASIVQIFKEESYKERGNYRGHPSLPQQHNALIQLHHREAHPKADCD
ncbi:hypothetical protein CHS0354_042229 [Potamilus streckersoni]|uniref:Uncharacterized protein n=1 Tax=Potamilus streckersoni TaxID=2493646 RepID=A0AAE0TM25_9BIVA|nr:hypothetical protein CHS0354_042229 [Potamilus streckersoni]